jgi:hypothetical protein
MIKRFLLAAAILLGGFGVSHATCNNPNPNLLGPPFVDNCPLPAASLTRLLTNPVGTGHYFANQNPPAIFVRQLDRVLIGGATTTNGNIPSSGTWLSNASAGGVPGVYAYLEGISEEMVYSPNGYPAIFAASRSSDNTDPGHCCSMGVADFVYNNNTANPQAVWGLYSTIVRAAGAGPTQNELDVANLGSDESSTPYNNSTNATLGWGMGCGGEASTVVSTVSCNAAILIGANTSAWHSGIIFHAGALVGAGGSSGTGEMIGSYTGAMINWYCTANLNSAGAGNTPCAIMGSTTSGTVSNPQSLLITNNDVRITGATYASGEADLAMVTANTAQPANIKFYETSTLKWTIQKDGSNSFNILNVVTGHNAFTDASATGQVGIGEGAGTTLVINTDTMVESAMPTGTPVASVCIDTNGKFIKKTTSGACVP